MEELASGLRTNRAGRWLPGRSSTEWGPSHSQPSTKLSLPLPFPKLPGTSEAFTLLPTHFPALGYTLSRM